MPLLSGFGCLSFLSVCGQQIDVESDDDNGDVSGGGGGVADSVVLCVSTVLNLTERLVRVLLL